MWYTVTNYIILYNRSIIIKTHNNSIYLLNKYKKTMIHASIQAIMPIVLLGTWRTFVNKFDPYVMYRSFFFSFLHFLDKKFHVGMYICQLWIFTIGDQLTPLLGTTYPIQRVNWATLTTSFHLSLMLDIYSPTILRSTGKTPDKILEKVAKLPDSPPIYRQKFRL